MAILWEIDVSYEFTLLELNWTKRRLEDNDIKITWFHVDDNFVLEDNIYTKVTVSFEVRDDDTMYTCKMRGRLSRNTVYEIKDGKVLSHNGRWTINALDPNGIQAFIEVKEI